MNGSASELLPVPLRLELSGRLRNVGKIKHWYMGIAEAIQNSMDAISDSGNPGWITIEIQRDHDLVSSLGGARPIRSVVIRDNGIGFNDVNFKSFSTPDTQLKVAKGGKGVGRLMWLQAFKQISVDSIYRNGASSRRRQFVFQIESPELAAVDAESSSAELVTEVRLLDLRDDYSTTSTVTFETITDSLIEHFLPALVEKPAWLKSLTVSDGNKRADLTKVVEGEPNGRRNSLFVVQVPSSVLCNFSWRKKDRHGQTCRSWTDHKRKHATDRILSAAFGHDRRRRATHHTSSLPVFR